MSVNSLEESYDDFQLLSTRTLGRLVAFWKAECTTITGRLHVLSEENKSLRRQLTAAIKVKSDL